MITSEELYSTLRDRRILALDGALATELEARGHNIDSALWSAKMLQENPNAIKQVHADYFTAGADVAITASYQASVQGLADHSGMSFDEAVDLIKLSVKLALQAREDVYASGEVSPQRRLLVAGSVGPFGAYLADGSEYRGDYIRTLEEFKAFHRPRVQALLDAGADLLAIETMPNLSEIQAILSLLKEEFPTAVAWLSCTVKDSEHLSDGSSIRGLVNVAKKHSEQILALGINCVPINIVPDTLKVLGGEWEGPLICYPNSGEVYDASTHSWSGDRSHEEFAKHVPGWVSAGARMIGGCCRTNPKDIRQMADALQSS